MNYKFPKGSRGYDFENLTYDDYIAKYYNNTEPEWIEKMNHQVNLAFDENKHGEFKKLWSFKGTIFSFDKMYNFYNLIENDSRFEDDIKRFIAFMAGDGYFDHIGNPEFEVWIRAQNFDYPFKEDNDNPRERSLLSHTVMKNGMNAIRYKLLCSHWWKG